MIPENSELILHTYLIVFGGVLLIYDYALTLSMEVERFWLPHQVSATTVLYFANRYVGLLGYVPILYQFLGPVDGDIYESFYMYFVLVSVAVLMVLRVYALYNREPVVLWILGAHLVFGIILCAMLQWAGLFQDEAIPMKPPPIPHCVPYRSVKQGKALAAAWGLKPSFDLMVFILTIRKYSTFKQTPRPVLIEVLIEDGTLYFVASIPLSFLGIFFCLWGHPFLRAAGTPLTVVLCSIMGSRMTLNLRNPDIIPHPMETLSNPTPESEHLVSTILSLGHPSYTESLMRSRSEDWSSVIALRRMGTRGVD